MKMFDKMCDVFLGIIEKTSNKIFISIIEWSAPRLAFFVHPKESGGAPFFTRQGEADVTYGMISGNIFTNEAFDFSFQHVRQKCFFWNNAL